MFDSNTTLLEELSKDHVCTYEVANPFDTFVWIEGMCAGLIRRSRVVLIPLGPKIFALNCMLAAFVHFPRIMVLRVSGHGGHEQDVQASGEIFTIRANLHAEQNVGQEV